MSKIYSPPLARLLLFLFSTFCFCIHCQSQITNYSSNEIIAQGDAGVGAKGKASLYSNPAGSTSIKHLTLTANYFMPFITNELSNQNLSLALPTKHGTIYSIIRRYGYNLYNENCLSLGFAKSITPIFNICLHFNVQHNQVYETGNGQQVFSCFGLQFSPHSSINIGFFAFNPEKARIKIKNNKQTIPSYLNFGFKWQPHSQFSVSSELNKTINYNTITRFGMEYKINQAIIARVGTFGKPITYTLGIGIKLKSLNIDTSMTNHQTLGISSGIGISYKFISKK